MSSLSSPAFPDDDGSADPEVAEALTRYGASDDLRPALSALSRTRLLVPVVAVAGAERAPDGSDKQADMAAVLMKGRDGRQALLAFSCLESMRTWDPDARPVPVPAARAAEAARTEEAAAIVVDIAGPVRAVITGDDLVQLASGNILVPTDLGYAWVSRS